MLRWLRLNHLNISQLSQHLLTMDLTKDYAIYNHWANQKMADWLLQKSDEQFEQTIASSFPSMRLTVLHIWDAELAWMDRLQGQQKDFDTYPTKTFKGTNKEILAGFVANSADLRDFVLKLSKKKMASPSSYEAPDGKTYTQTFAEILQHVIQHSTFHRGQLVTMARGLGITDLPKTDFIHYLRQKSYFL
jgi:uncharacterized damage-inducible protein DinB